MRPPPARSVLLVAALLAGCGDGMGPPAPSGLLVAFSLHAPSGISAAEGVALGSAFDRVDRFRVRVEDAFSHTVYADTVIRVTPGAQAYTLAVDIPESALGASLTVTVVGLVGDLELFVATTESSFTAEGGETTLEIPVRYTGPGVRGSVADGSGKGLAGVAVRVLQGGAEVASTTTATDGTFLFMDLAPGTYLVRPQAPSGGTACPGERTVTVGGTSAAVVAAFRIAAGGCTARVLVVSGGDVDDTGAAADAVSGTGISVGTFFYVSGTPGLDALRGYDVVVLYQNGLFDESVDLGNEIAQYVALGGNVVFGSFYWQGRSDGVPGSTGWGALEGMDPFGAAGGASYTPSSLGATTPHPLTAGVSSLSSSGFRGGVTSGGGTTVVASWADGVPLVGFRQESAGQRLVAVSLFPAHAAVGGVSGDFATLWQNAVRWAGEAGGPAATGPAPGGH